VKKDSVVVHYSLLAYRSKCEFRK